MRFCACDGFIFDEEYVRVLVLGACIDRSGSASGGACAGLVMSLMVDGDLRQEIASYVASPRRPNSEHLRTVRSKAGSG